MIYLASPYSHHDPLVMRTRFLLVEQETALYLNKGIHIYSPIVHCHELAHKYSLPKDFAFWMNYNLDMLRRADALWVLVIDGWQDSRGVRTEIQAAEAVRMPVEYRVVVE